MFVITEIHCKYLQIMNKVQNHWFIQKTNTFQIQAQNWNVGSSSCVTPPCLSASSSACPSGSSSMTPSTTTRDSTPTWSQCQQPIFRQQFWKADLKERIIELECFSLSINDAMASLKLSTNDISGFNRFVKLEQKSVTMGGEDVKNERISVTSFV